MNNISVSNGSNIINIDRTRLSSSTNSTASNNVNIISYEKFVTYYERQIELLKRRLCETISSIISIRSDSLVNIQIVPEGTCISYRNEKIKKGNFIDFVEHISLKIGYKEIMLMYAICDMNLFNSFNKLVTHEFLHVLFGDFDRAKLNKVYNYANGSLKNPPKNDPYYIASDAPYDNNGYKKINNEVYNYAADFVINREICITKPFLRAEDYGLEPDLSVFQYYSILINDESVLKSITDKIKSSACVSDETIGEIFDKFFSDKRNESIGSGDESDDCDNEGNNKENNGSNDGNGGGFGEATEGDKIGSGVVSANIDGEDIIFFFNDDFRGETNGMNMTPISNEKMSQVNDEDLLEDLFFGKSRGLDASNLDIVIRQLKKKKSIFFEYTDKVISEIKDDLYNQQDVNYSKDTSWFKYNNRRENGDFILPGKMPIVDDKAKDYTKKSAPIIFIDCSSSMNDIMKELFYFSYNLLSHINCTVVFYNTRITKVINYANSLNFNVSMFAGGGTDLKKAIEEYKKDYNNNISNIYIFSDGCDEYSDLDIDYATVYKFDKHSGVKKIFVKEKDKKTTIK